MGLITTAVKALGGITPVALIGTVIGMGVLLIIKKWVKFPEKIIPYIWICFILSLSFLSAHQIVKWMDYRDLAYNVTMLTPKEREIIQSYIRKNTIEFYSKVHYSANIISLEKKHMIYKAYERRGGAVYNISPQYFDLLKEHSELIGLSPKTPSK